MKKTLPQKDYRTYERNVQLLIDESFAEKIIPAYDSVRLLDQIVEEMDLRQLERAYDVRGRKPATAPSTMLKILLYANMEGRYSSRGIHEACQRDINFIWLLNGAPAPSHHEIARFRSLRLSQCAEELFFQLVEKLSDYGEIKYEHLFVDGTKIEANANKYSFVWKKSTTKYEARNTRKLETAIETLSAKYGIICTEAEELLKALFQQVTEPFVYGRGHRKSELQRDIEFLAYDPELDEYTCQAGQKIRAKYVGKQKTKSGYEREVTYYECDDCSQCQFKKKCTRAKGNRKLQVSKKFLAQRTASLERITSPKGILLRMNRSIQSEGAFGVVKQDYG